MRGTRSWPAWNRGTSSEEQSLKLWSIRCFVCKLHASVNASACSCSDYSRSRSWAPLGPGTTLKHTAHICGPRDAHSNKRDTQPKSAKFFFCVPVVTVPVPVSQTIRYLCLHVCFSGYCAFVSQTLSFGRLRVYFRTVSLDRKWRVSQTHRHSGHLTVTDGLHKTLAPYS